MCLKCVLITIGLVEFSTVCRHIIVYNIVRFEDGCDSEDIGK